MMVQAYVLFKVSSGTERRSVKKLPTLTRF